MNDSDPLDDELEPLPVPIGDLDEDAESLLNTVALIEAHLADDAQAIAALLSGDVIEVDGRPYVAAIEVAGTVQACLALFEALHHTVPELVDELLRDTRARNLR